MKISVLSNSTMIGKDDVAEALLKVDNNILKLDSAIEETMRAIDCPGSKDFTVEKVVEQLCRFKGQCIIQTMMLRGEHKGKTIDNTTKEEVESLIAAYKKNSAVRSYAILHRQTYSGKKPPQGRER